MAEKKATSVNFQPNEKAIAMQPVMLKKAISGKTPFKPNKSWITFGSVDKRPISEPDALPSRSKNGIGFRSIFRKYSSR
jgi:hypothetical protein